MIVLLLLLRQLGFVTVAEGAARCAGRCTPGQRL